MKKDSTHDPITPERARELVDKVWMNGDGADEQNAALMALIVGIADHEGDPDRYHAACAAIKHGFSYSRVGEDALAAYLASAVVDGCTDQEEDDDEARTTNVVHEFQARRQDDEPS